MGQNYFRVIYDNKENQKLQNDYAAVKSLKNCHLKETSKIHIDENNGSSYINNKFIIMESGILGMIDKKTNHIQQTKYIVRDNFLF